MDAPLVLKQERGPGLLDIAQGAPAENRFSFYRDLSAVPDGGPGPLPPPP